MKRIALYGGSFDPPHFGHVLTITAILNAERVDEIWLVPTGVRHDKNQHSSVEDRQSMVRIMLATVFGPNHSIKLVTTQLDNRQEESTTYKLLQDMKLKYPCNEFFFVIGADLANDIPNWVDSNKLIKSEKFLMIPRLGVDHKDRLPDYIETIPGNSIVSTNISSSLARDLIKQGRNLQGIIPSSVGHYIAKNGLYHTRHDGEILTIDYEGKFIRLVNDNNWEYVERTNCTGVVVIVAMTRQNELIFTEQYRPPVKKHVIEFPAGLVNDLGELKLESNETAAMRELLEETGFQADEMTTLTVGPTSAGLTNELITILLATNCDKIAEGGGDDTESIVVHLVPIANAEQWLKGTEKRGCLVDPKVYAGLYFAQKYNN